MTKRAPSENGRTGFYRIALISFHGCPVARLGEKDTGGMNVYVLQTARELGRRGHLVDVYTRYHDPNDEQITELDDNVRVVHLKAGPFGESKESLSRHIPKFLSELYSFQEARGVVYDLVHSHYWLSGKVGIDLARRWRVPHVACFHTLARIKQKARRGERAPAGRIASELEVIGSADAIIGLSRYEKEDAVTLYGADPGKINVIPAGVDLNMFRPMDKSLARKTLGLKKNEKVVLFVGRIEPLKGVDMLIDAFASLEQASKRLIVIGGDPFEDVEVLKLKKRVERLGLNGSVQFLGTVRQSDLPVYYNAANVCVIPSYYESFGLVALESMACGTPVIASRVGGLQTIVKNKKTGYLISWRAPHHFAERMETLLSNPAIQLSMAEAAMAEARRMSWERTVDRLVSLYDSLAGVRVATAAGK